MKRLLQKLSNAGIDAATGWREAKGIKLRNRIALVTALLISANIPLQLFFWPQSRITLYILCVEIPLLLLPVFLNARRLYAFSYGLFMVVGQSAIIVYTLLGGPGTHTALFTVTVILSAFFCGGNEHPKLRNAILAYCVLAFLSLELFFQFFPPLLAFEPLYLEWLRRTIDIGMIAFTLGISLDIASEIRGADDEIENERQKSEKLLLNVLPQAIATQLKLNHGVIAERYEESSVLFADIAGFTTISSTMAPDKVVQMLDAVFREFDHLAQKLGLEKIKTIGDAYMVAAGLPERRSDHCEAIFELAVEMQGLMREKFSRQYNGLALRIGIHTGPVVAGVIGTVKFAYDLWGDTVNTASRMESHGVTGQIHVTEAVYECLKDRYAFERRGELDIKGKGKMTTYLFAA